MKTRRVGPRGRAIVLAVIMLLSVVSMTAAVMPGAADDATIVAERSFAEDTIEPGDQIEVELEIELLADGTELDVIDEVEPQVLEEGTDLDVFDMDAPYGPEISAAGVSGAVVVWDNQSWEAGDTITIPYTLNTSEDMEDGDTFTFSSNSTYDGESYEIGGADTVTVEADEPEPEPANYQLSDLDPADATVTEGDDPIDLSVTVENIGEDVGEQDIELEIVNDTEDVIHDDAVEALSLDADASETVMFEAVPAGDFDVGDYEVAVSSANDTITGSLTVTEAVPDPEPAEYQLSDLDPSDATVTEGDDPIDLSVTVENIGEELGEQDIALEIVNDTDSVVYGDTVDAVALDEGASEAVTFEAIPAGDFDVGDYEVAVSSANDTITGSLTVDEAVAVPSPTPATFQLSDLDPSDATVTEGDDPIDLSVTVENIGEELGEQDIALEIVNETDIVVYDESVDAVVLDDGAAEAVTFEAVPAGDFDVGDYEVAVSSANDTITGSLTVTEAVLDPEPAEYQLSDLDPSDATVTEGDDPIDLSVIVENIGEELGEQNIELEIVNTTTDEVVLDDAVTDVEIPGGEQETVTFEEVAVGDLDAGEYDVTVSSDNDSVAGTLTVESEEPFLDDALPGFTPVVALVALLGAGLLAARRA